MEGKGKACSIGDLRKSAMSAAVISNNHRKYIE
jgi:hypothetical protein